MLDASVYVSNKIHELFDALKTYLNTSLPAQIIIASLL